ncbi:MAG: LuxR C-terminal-related transcriptional regulator, partial [Bacteroidota bacterium]|nr:LuxR C-terminal-related transcriptional regulator [Bacteroidota bacterium]
TKNIKLETELKFKKHELMNIAINIINLNEFLEKLTSEINLIKKKKEIDIGYNDLNKLSLLITNSIDLQQDRKTLNLYIDELNSDFYYRLNNKYPNLTNNEKKLCSLLRLHLTSKQISSLLNISPKSVEVNRYRLRQKLGASHKDKLTDIIGSI